LTLTWNGKRFDWVNVVYFATIHVMALGAFWTFSWTGLALLIGINWVAGSLGIGVTFHRLLTHRGYKAPKALEYLGTLCGMLATVEDGRLLGVGLTIGEDEDGGAETDGIGRL